MFHRNSIVALIDRDIHYLTQLQKGEITAEQREPTQHPTGVDGFRVVFYGHNGHAVQVESVRHLARAANKEDDSHFGLPVTWPMWTGDSVLDKAYQDSDTPYAWRLIDILALCIKELQEEAEDKELWLRTFCLMLAEIVVDNTDHPMEKEDNFLVATHFFNRLLGVKGTESLTVQAFSVCPKREFDALMAYLRGETRFGQSDVYFAVVADNVPLSRDTFVDTLCQYHDDMDLEGIGYMMPVDIFNGPYISDVKKDFISLSDVMNDVLARGATAGFWDALTLILDNIMKSQYEEDIDIWKGEPLDIDSIAQYLTRYRLANPVRPYRL